MAEKMAVKPQIRTVRDKDRRWVPELSTAKSPKDAKKVEPKQSEKRR